MRRQRYGSRFADLWGDPKCRADLFRHAGTVEQLGIIAAQMYVPCAKGTFPKALKPLKIKPKGWRLRFYKHPCLRVNFPHTCQRTVPPIRGLAQRKLLIQRACAPFHHLGCIDPRQKLRRLIHMGDNLNFFGEGREQRAKPLQL